MVSVTIPAYNCEKVLADVAKSAVEQAWQDMEVLIIDWVQPTF